MQLEIKTVNQYYSGFGNSGYLNFDSKRLKRAAIPASNYFYDRKTKVQGCVGGKPDLTTPPKILPAPGKFLTTPGKMRKWVGQ